MNLESGIGHALIFSIISSLIFSQTMNIIPAIVTGTIIGVSIGTIARSAKRPTSYTAQCTTE